MREMLFLSRLGLGGSGVTTTNITNTLYSLIERTIFNGKMQSRNGGGEEGWSGQGLGVQRGRVSEQTLNRGSRAGPIEKVT